MKMISTKLQKMYTQSMLHVALLSTPPEPISTLFRNTPEKAQDLPLPSYLNHPSLDMKPWSCDILCYAPW